MPERVHRQRVQRLPPKHLITSAASDQTPEAIAIEQLGADDVLDSGRTRPTFAGLLVEQPPIWMICLVPALCRALKHAQWQGCDGPGNQRHAAINSGHLHS